MSLTQSNLKQLQFQATPAKNVEADSQSKSSYRSLRSSQQGGYFASKQQLKSGISEKQKVKLQQLYSDMSAGKITKDKFVETIKSDMRLKTNETFDKTVGQVDFNYGEVFRGIEKQYREENKNLKPNTCDPAIVTGYDLTLSVGKFQEKFLPVPNFDKSNEIQRACLEEVNKLRSGTVSSQNFLKNLQQHGLSTDMIEREIRELNSSNHASYSKISKGVFRALEEQRRDQHDATALGLNDHPARGDADFNVQANDQRVYFAVPTQQQEDSKEAIYLDKQMRTLSNGNVYNELKRPAPEYVLAAKNNGDIFTWQERPDIIANPQQEVKQREQKHMESQIKFIDPPAIPQPVEVPSHLKKKIISQTTSTRNILAYESEAIVSPKKNIQMLNGYGDIISWGSQTKH